jgi:multisubunit Na+/H+ antiporter MnhC subunit
VESVPIAIGTLPVLQNSNDFKKVIRVFLINRGVKFVPITTGILPLQTEKADLESQLFLFVDSTLLLFCD